MTTQNNKKISIEMYCEKCDYLAKRKSDFKKHLQSKKHNDDPSKNKDYICLCGNKYKYRQNLYRHKKCCIIHIENDTEQKNGKKMAKNGKKWQKIEKCPISYICDCGKSYKHQCSLSKHKKICKIIKEQDSDLKIDKNMFMKILEKNDELIDKIVEISKEPKTTITNNNNQFNVMNYLNTECKDAMNFSDFINDFVFSLDDLNLLHEKGYQEAMEQTFIKQLKDMDKSKRPIHCSDKKRKSFYIKDKNIWIKDENNLKILDGVKEITHKQFGAIQQWATYNKDWLDVEKKQDFFNMSISELSKAKKEKYLNKLIIRLTGLSLK
jgi:hypothetical protein